MCSGFSYLIRKQLYISLPLPGFVMIIKSNVIDKSVGGTCCVPSCILRVKPITGAHEKLKKKCFIALVLSNKLALIVFLKSQK